MKIKRILAVILSAVMLLGCLPMVASAEESDIENQNMMLSSDDITLSGTNSVGNMLAAELEEAKEQSEGSGNVIFSVEIEENSAVAELSTAVTATLFVGIYSEDGTALFSSGYTEVVPEDEFAVVELEGEIPEYFYVKAYLVDTEDYSPLSAVYNNAMYTQEMQEFLSKTTDDFAEDRVINLDGDKTTNFAVLGDGIINLDDGDDKNIVDYVSGSHFCNIKIGNIDTSILKLRPGRVIYFTYRNEMYVVLIQQMETDDTNAVIVGQEVDFGKAFDYIRIDVESGITESSVDDSACGEGITFEGLEQPAAYSLRASGEGSIGTNAKFKINYKTFGEDGAKVTVDGNINLKVVFSPKYYLTKNYKYVELKLDYSISGGLSATGKLEYEQPLAVLSFRIPFVDIKVVPNFVFNASGSIGFTGTLLKGTIGYGWYSDVGGVNLTSTPKCEAEIKTAVNVFIGFSTETEVEILKGLLADVSMESNLGAELSAEIKGSSSELSNTSEKHDCLVCVDGDIYGKLDLSVEGELLKNDDWKLSLEIAEIRAKILDFYWSVNYDEFGFTTCPHKSYKLDVVVSNSSGNAIAGAIVSVNGESYNTEKNGKISTYLPNGNYKVKVSETNSISKEQAVDILDDSKIINIKLKDRPNINDPVLGLKKPSLGSDHSAFITENGDLYLWGKNSHGQLGDGTTVDSYTPKKIMSNVAMVSLGGGHSAAITKNGDLYMWGWNDNWQLGDGTVYESYTPKKIMENVVEVSLGNKHSAAITKNGDLYTWGYNYYGQIGDGTNGSKSDCRTPKKIMSNIALVNLGSYHSAAIDKNGDLYMWGYNYSGELGDGTTNWGKIPKLLMSSVISVSLGHMCSAAITENGDLYMWGDNEWGQFGDGTRVDSKTPKKLMSNVASFDIGTDHCAVITENGDLYMWGYNKYHKIGDFGNLGTIRTPTKIMSNIASVSLGSEHSAAITENGKLYLWGRNLEGQLGDGTTTSSGIPIKITIPSAASQSVMLFSVAPATDVLEESVFESLAPNTIYNFYIMKDKMSENALSGENLLYVNQATTDSEGTVTFEYLNTGTDFDNAEKLVVKYKNPLPDNTVSGVAITASADKVFLNVGGNTLLSNGYENIRAEITLNGKTAEISEYTANQNGLLFSCDIPDGAAYNSVISVKLLADFDGKTYECRETHRTLAEAQSDTNADGIVDSLDLTTLRRVLLSFESGNNTAYDPNADGSINIRDLVRLKKYLAG